MQRDGRGLIDRRGYTYSILTLKCWWLLKMHGQGRIAEIVEMAKREVGLRGQDSMSVQALLHAFPLPKAPTLCIGTLL